MITTMRDAGIAFDAAGISAEGLNDEILEALTRKGDGRYYLLTMFLPMGLIVFMAWTAFWLQPDIVNPRLGISTAAIFSLIALGVSIRLGLPRISYLTNGEKADFVQEGDTLKFTLPAQPLNEYDTVVKVIFTKSIGEQ